MYNPEPLAEFFDMFYIGEGEVVYDELLEAYKKWKRAGKSRKEFLEMAAEIEGIYGSGDSARLYPWMSFLSGGNGLPSDTSA